MKSDDAIRAAKRLNETGKHRGEWFYYPAHHETLHTWFVVRRPKTTQIYIAIFADGREAVRES